MDHIAHWAKVQRLFVSFSLEHNYCRAISCHCNAMHLICHVMLHVIIATSSDCHVLHLIYLVMIHVVIAMSCHPLLCLASNLSLSCYMWLLSCHIISSPCYACDFPCYATCDYRIVTLYCCYVLHLICNVLLCHVMLHWLLLHHVISSSYLAFDFPCRVAGYCCRVLSLLHVIFELHFLTQVESHDHTLEDGHVNP